MTDILRKATVLVKNRHWQAINVRTPQEAFCMMATNVATGLDVSRILRGSRVNPMGRSAVERPGICLHRVVARGERMN